MVFLRNFLLSPFLSPSTCQSSRVTLQFRNVLRLSRSKSPLFSYNRHEVFPQKKNIDDGIGLPVMKPKENNSIL